MSKVLAVMLAGLFAAAGAYAQGDTPNSQEAAPPTNTRPQQRATERRASKPQGEVRPAGGDQRQSSEGTGGVVPSKATAAGQARADTRSDRRRDKHGNVRKMNPQGGTPN